MLAQKHAQPWAYMTACVLQVDELLLYLTKLSRYGRIKGLHCSENRALLQSILRDDWKFDGIVMSDW